MPGPLFGPAAILASGPGAVAAAKHLAIRVASSPAARIATSPGVTSTSLILYYLFQKLPDWVKDDISFKNLVRKNGNRDDPQLEGIYSVLGKLQKVVNNIQELDTDIPQIHAAFLAFIQLSGQNKLNQIEGYRAAAIAKQEKLRISETSLDDDASSCSPISETPILPTTIPRDTLYENAGNELDMATLRSEEIQTALKMATYAYYEDSEMLAEKLLQKDYTLLHYNLSDIRPGKVAHYIALCPTERRVVIGLRGTSTLGDLLTDCCGHAVPLEDPHSGFGDKTRVEIKAAVPNIVLADSREEAMEVISGHERIVLEDHDDDGDNYARCHEGIWISAKNVLNEIESLLLPLIECRYRILLCGHSLGAGTAVLVAFLLRSRHPERFLEDESMHVYAFGAPPVLDHDSSIAAARYCTSIIHNADLISRLNIPNLSVSLACLRRIQNQLSKDNLSPTGPMNSVAFFQRLAQGTSGVPLLTQSELDETIDHAHGKLALRKPEHLFVPGRVLLVYKPWFEGESESPHHFKCVETTGTSPVFQRLEIDGLRCFTDHLTSSYFEVLGMVYDY